MAHSGRMTELPLARDQTSSPERTKVWTSKSDRRSVPVVYYLSRNGHLEHPHFMEVPLSSSAQGLFLRDVIARLNVLRGKGMAAMYSWSCKRSYKNGFVWHDLSENDFIYPARGHEYVLKGSELLDHSFLEAASDRRRRNQSCSSIEYEYEYSVYKAEPSSRSAADASTQTEDSRRRRPAEEMEISPPPSDSSPETLLKANKESTMERASTSTKSSVLMQLISCGSLSFKDCGAGQVISQYRMRVPRGRVKLDEKEYFSGSIVQTKKQEPALKRCNSYTAARSL